MVVCNNLMQLPSACTAVPYIPGICQVGGIPVVACNQRYPPILSAPVITQHPTSQQTPSVQCSPPPQHQYPTPPDSPRTSTPPTPTVVPCTISLSNGVIIPYKLINTSQQQTTEGAPQQRLVNGPTVYQCIPGVCPMSSPAMVPTAQYEVIPSSPTLPSTPLSNIYAHISAWKQSYGMEHVWQHDFRSLFTQYEPHNWMLFPVISKPQGVWHANVDSAKVRFCCEECGHGWTSMKGRVAFWFLWNPVSGEGVVCVKLYGQQCDRCKKGNYEPAMWYPEEVLKVLVNIYNRVGQVYYGFQQAPYHRARRAGKPRTPHNSDLCQACKDGVCSERR